MNFIRNTRRLIEQAGVLRAMRALPLLAELPENDLRALVIAGVPVTQPADWSVVHQGTPADAGYLLVEGEADVLRDGARMATLGPGDVFGGGLLLRRGLSESTVVTRTPVSLLHMDAQTFRMLLRARPALQACLALAREREQAILARVPESVQVRRVGRPVLRPHLAVEGA
jgi:CRP-like cAMP-binding protein